MGGRAAGAASGDVEVDVAGEPAGDAADAPTPARTGRRAGARWMPHRRRRIDRLVAAVQAETLASPDLSMDADALTTLARGLVEIYGLRAAAVFSWDTETAAGRRDQRGWAATGPSPAGGPPGPDDVVLRIPDQLGSDRLGEVIGYLRTDPAMVTVKAIEPAVEMAARILDAASAARAGAALRVATVAAETELLDLRQEALVEMDLLRRELERDLHDGAQSELVGLKVQLALLECHPAQDWGPAMEVEAAQLAHQVGELRGRIEAMASGAALRSLRELGLGPALRAALPAFPPPSRLTLEDRLGAARESGQVEEVTYFCALEAVTNAVKHAPGADVTLTLEDVPAGLRLTVRDTGPGFDGPSRGGLRTLRQRAELVGARLQVESSHDRGTTVTLVVPRRG